MNDSQLLRWTIGDVRITAIVETTMPFPFEMGFEKRFDPAVLENNKDWLQPNYDNGDGTFTMAFQAFVVESKGKTILIDTCIGESPIPMEIPIEGDRFLQNLEQAGFTVSDIDYVLCTHMHFDHVGWNTRKVAGNIVPTFPNARYLFAREEYDFWKKDSKNDLVSNFHHSVAPLLETDLVDLVPTHHKLTEEVKLIPTFGHSPGHVSVVIDSQKEGALITGDCTHHPVQWTAPDWAFFTDYNQEQSSETRKKLLPTLVDSGRLILGTHYNAPASGKLISEGDRVVFKALK